MIEAIVGHLVGDYLLQNDWMALNKKKSTFHCVVHCLIWTACVCLFSWGTIGVIGGVVLFVTHFVQDRTNVIGVYMDAIGQEQFRTGICSPWSIIVVDNVWHVVTIFAVIKLGL